MQGTPVTAESDHRVGQEIVDRHVFKSFASYLEFLEDWLIYKRTPRDLPFTAWLEQSGKSVPQDYYDLLLIVSGGRERAARSPPPS